MKKLIVVHDRTGRIISVGLVADDAVGGIKLQLASGHSVVELDAQGDLTQEALINIHHHCYFDIRAGKLVVRGQTARASETAPWPATANTAGREL